MMQIAVLKLESGKTFDATDDDRTQNRVDDRDKVSKSLFKKRRKSQGIDDQNPIAKPNLNRNARRI